MTQTTQDFNSGLKAFLDASPTPFHAVTSMIALLEIGGYRSLDESQAWDLKPGAKHYVTRNGSSIIAFVVGTEPLAKSGLRLAGAHTDSPCLMVKPQPEINNMGYFQLGVEVYGGALLNPWFDRDLSIAGRIVYRDQAQQLKQKAVDFKQPVAMIPSLAIHLDREANSGRSINAQNDIPPVLFLEDGLTGSTDFRTLLADRFLGEDSEVLDYELCFYDTQPAAEIGLKQEFLGQVCLWCLIKKTLFLSCFLPK